MDFSNEKGVEKSLQPYLRNLELLVLQFGVQLHEIEKILREIIGESKKAASIDLFVVYHAALSVLADYRGSVTAKELEHEGKRLFLYEEDEQFHLAICKMPNDLKVPFILASFHDFSPAEIVALTQQSEEAISHNIDAAKKKLMEELNLLPKQFEASVNFMKKTYARTPELIDEDKSITQDDKEGNQEKTQQQKDKSLLVKQVIAVSLIITFFSSLFFISVTGAGQVDEEYIAKLEQEFEETMEDQREQLGLRKEVYSQIWYISNAKSSFIVFKNEVNRELASGKQLKRKEVKKKFEEVLDLFELPSEMAAGLFKNPLKNNEEESFLFMESYSRKLHEIMRAFTLESNSKKIMESFSGDLQKGMDSQNLSVSDNKLYFTPEFKESEFTERLRSSLHPSMEPYIAMLQMEGQLYLEEPKPPAELADAALVLEDILLNDTRRTYLYEHARNLYFQTFVAITSGPSIYRKNLTIKDEYRDAWIKLSEMKETSPIGKVLSDVVTEMKESGWTKSTTLRYIDSSIDLDRALALAQLGTLHEYRPTVREYQRYEYSSILLPDESFQQEVVELSKVLEEQVDLNSRPFFAVDPLIIVGAYDLAQREENGKVLWYLTWKFYPYEKFMEHYEVGEPILDGVDRITFDPELILYNRGVVYPILFERNGVTEVGLWLSQLGSDWVIEKIVSKEDE